MNEIDLAILDHCRGDLRPLKPLKERIAPGTLYRHAGGLLDRGWLEKRGALYRATEAGVRQLAEAAARCHWNRLDKMYAPLALVPSALHHALITLIVAACICRQHETRADRHPYFVIFGGTLKWKTSLAIFVCHMLGLDPAVLTVDCGAEAGKSLWVRRGASGTLVFKREILDAAFLTLDEFSSAEASVRNAIGILLSGRLVMPVENEGLTIRAVPLLTLNPRPKATLEEQLGLSAPQIRRAILANVDAVALPDLAATGERAIVAARAATPIQLTAPTVDCGTYHRVIVDLVRAVIIPEAHERVDVEVAVNLSTGMTAFIREPAEAVAEVLHALGIVAESLGWARPGWVEAVAAFALDARPASGVPNAALALALPAKVGTPAGTSQGESHASHTVSLEVPRTGRRDDIVPDLALDPALKARLVWFSVESGLPPRVALARLLNFYLFWHRNKATVHTLWAILRLAEELKVREVDRDTLLEYLGAKAKLAAYGCSFADVPEALNLLDLLGRLPHDWTWAQAQAAIQSVAKIMAAGIDGPQVEVFLDRHQQLIESGFDEAMAEALATILTQAGATGERRDFVIRALVENAGATVDRDTLDHEHQRLQQDIAHLTAARDALSPRVKALKTRITNLQAAAAAASGEKVRLEHECHVRRIDLDVLRGLRALLLGNTVEADSFLSDVERLQQLRRQGRMPDAQYATRVADLRAKVFEFFKRIAEEATGA